MRYLTLAEVNHAFVDGDKRPGKTFSMSEAGSISDAEQEGIDAATRDVAAGVLRYKWLGHSGLDGKDFCRIVGERFGMVVDDFGLCAVWQNKIDFARGYNRVVRDHLIGRYGRDVVADAMNEARALHKECHARWLASLESNGDTE